MSTRGTAEFESTVQPWGNSLGLRITRAVSELAHLDKGTRVSIEVTADGLVIRRKLAAKQRAPLPYTEADLLKGLTPLTAHADELPSLVAAEHGA
jgi:antitoxin MazE